jgi:hypothetical protein
MPIMKSYGRYAASVLFAIAVIILVVIGFNLIRNIIRDEPPANQGEQQTTRDVNLVEEGRAGKPVRYTIIGGVVGNEEHRNVRITVEPGSRLAEIIQGYDGQVVSSQRTPNTRQAYDAFISALAGAGFVRLAERGSSLIEAETCPLGQRFNYEVAPGMSGAFYSWSASCGARQGTFGGNHQTVDTLFKRQIPDYGNFTQDVRFNGYTTSS